MAKNKEYSCAITGKPVQADAPRNVTVRISESLMITVVPHVKSVNGAFFENGRLSADAADSIRKALEKIKPVEAKG